MALKLFFLKIHIHEKCFSAEKPDLAGKRTEAGSPSRTRTSDPMINSHLLYQLSYWGTQTASEGL